MEELVEMVGLLYDKYLVLYTRNPDEQQFLYGYAQAIHDIIDQMNKEVY